MCRQRAFDVCAVSYARLALPLPIDSGQINGADGNGLRHVDTESPNGHNLAQNNTDTGHLLCCTRLHSQQLARSFRAHTTTTGACLCMNVCDPSHRLSSICFCPKLWQTLAFVNLRCVALSLCRQVTLVLLPITRQRLRCGTFPPVSANANCNG